MSVDDILNIMEALESPTQLIMQTNRHNQFGDRLPDNVVAFVEYNASDKERVAIIEFDSDVDSEFVDETKGETEYHTVVTIFEPDTQRDGLSFDYAEELLSNPNNFELEIVEKQSVLSVTGEKHPNTKNELPSINNIPDSAENVKEKQLEIIQKTNPAPNEYSTWVRSVEDIKTLAETLEDDEWADYDEFNPDLTADDIREAVERGSITVYSSYPIENGVFVSPSRMEAESYSGTGEIYEKTVNIEDVAWIDPTQGQYAKIEAETEGKTDFSVSDKSDDIAPVGDFSTPLNELYYDDFAPIRSDIVPAKVATDTNVGGKSKASATDDDMAPAVAENVVTDAPIRDDVASKCNMNNTCSALALLYSCCLLVFFILLFNYIFFRF